MDKNCGLTEQTISEIAGHYAEILRLLGEDVSREGLVKTPSGRPAPWHILHAATVRTLMP